MNIFFPKDQGEITLPSLDGYSITLRENSAILFPKKQLPGFLNIEISFYRYKDIVIGDSGDIIVFYNNGNIIYQFPIITCEINSSSGIIRVLTKSLEYQIATWLIRIFGNPTNPKRSVLPRDIEHLRTLISLPYNIDKVQQYIRTHPQFDGEENQILNMLLKLLNF
ncbi:MAG: hypothetical protein N2482_00630 [Patescibacteria group bacterium]|nr:hypothetical protein [Patescibacteria group bacterium]